MASGVLQSQPLNELPNKLDEIDKNKTIVTMCHTMTAEIVRLFLKLQGFDARYLTDGILGIVESLRGDDYIKGKLGLNPLSSKLIKRKKYENNINTNSAA